MMVCFRSICNAAHDQRHHFELSTVKHTLICQQNSKYFNSMSAESLGIGSRVEHPHFGRGVVVESLPETITIWFKNSGAAKTVSRDFGGLRILASVEATADRASSEISGNGSGVSMAEIEHALETVLDRRLHDVTGEQVPLGARWQGGTLALQPADSSLQGKELPIETFFHKIVMVRDRLRLIEQKINAHKGLSPEEKVDLHQYITGIYGSLTSFNVLFKETHHQFKGSGEK
jgi:hypothetical protein